MLGDEFFIIRSTGMFPRLRKKTRSPLRRNQRERPLAYQ